MLNTSKIMIDTCRIKTKEMLNYLTIEVKHFNSFDVNTNKPMYTISYITKIKF
jgi:hypothetical protein